MHVLKGVKRKSKLPKGRVVYDLLQRERIHTLPKGERSMVKGGEQIEERKLGAKEDA